VVRAPEVLDHKADLMTRLDNPMVRRMWRAQVAEDIVRPRATAQEALPDERMASSQAGAVIEAMRITLPKAEAFHVNQEMCSLVQYAASQLDELDRIDRTIMPSRSGIARFEGGLPFQDVRGRKMLISWAVWCPVMVQYARPRQDSGEPFEATVIYLFNDHREEPDEIYDLLPASAAETDSPAEAMEMLERTLGRWGFIGANNVYDQMRLGPALMETSPEHVASILIDGDVPHDYTNPLRLMHAFWLLLGQTVADVSDAPIDRARRKRTGRMGIPDRVTVIQLRRTESKRAEGESLVEWSHRWVVRGHWAWYHVGPDHPLAQEVEPGRYMARIWRAPFVKGPAGKPLVVTDKVYALHR
jgi:hypothetical protein